MDRVRHAEHGEGVIESWRRGGRVAVVRFEALPSPVEVPRRELRGFAPTASEPPVAPAVPEPPAAPPKLAGSYETHRAALTLEAMRLGVVPETDLEAYTVGRDAEDALVEADLDAVEAHGGRVRAFLGDYGSGKTHILEVAQQHALARGFVTAHVTLDPDETPPSHPQRVYRGLMRTLRYPDRPHEEGMGLRPLIEAAAGDPSALAALAVRPAATGSTEERLAKGLHLYLSPAVAYMRTLLSSPDVDADALEGATDLLMDWIEGHPTVATYDVDRRLKRLPGVHPKIYSLKDYRPWSRIYGYILSGIGALARTVGYNGLAILIDEAEFYALLSSENRAFAAQLFKAWSWAAVGGGGAPDQEDLPFEEDAIAMGGMGVLKRLPGRASDHPGLYLAYAMTPSEDGLTAMSGALPAGATHSLTGLQTDEYLALSRRVCDFYASAVPDWSLPAPVVAPLGKVLAGLVGAGLVANPRQAMKFIIEFLDVVRYQPAGVPAVIRGLQQHLLL